MPIPEFCEGGDFNRFVVLKMQDIENILSDLEKEDLSAICCSIAHGRRQAGKTHNIYLVINTDEPYAPEIVEILKRNGHWG